MASQHSSDAGLQPNNEKGTLDGQVYNFKSLIVKLKIQDAAKKPGLLLPNAHWTDIATNDSHHRGTVPHRLALKLAELDYQGPSHSLQQIHYRSYKYTIVLYHYSAYLLPVRAFLGTIAATLDQNGYNHSRAGEDPLSNFLVPAGDEIIIGKVEAAYLPNIFKGKGSAVGFRDVENNHIVWMCFRQPAEAVLETTRGPNGRKLFDKVAYLEKGGTGEKGHAEHRAWYESLKSAPKTTSEFNLDWTWMNERAKTQVLKKKEKESTAWQMGSKKVHSNRQSRGSGLRAR